MVIQERDIIIVQDPWCPELPIIYRVLQVIPVTINGIRKDWYVVDGDRPGVYFEEVIFWLREAFIVYVRQLPDEWQVIIHDIFQLIAELVPEYKGATKIS